MPLGSGSGGDVTVSSLVSSRPFGDIHVGHLTTPPWVGGILLYQHGRGQRTSKASEVKASGGSNPSATAT
jgi:hypothetical protein